MAKYTPAKISSSIYLHWEHRKKLSMLKSVSKPQAIRSVFATQGVNLNTEMMSNILYTPDVTGTGAAIAEKPKTFSKKDKKWKNQKNNRGRHNPNQSSLDDRDSSNHSRSPRPDCITNGQKRDPCTGCDGSSHHFSKCYLTLGQKSDLLTDEAREKSQNNMKKASFRNRVDNLRKTPESNLDKLGGVDGGSLEKVISRVSALCQFNLNTRFLDTRLDSAASVYVFNIKKRYSNLNKALKGHGLVCGNKVISIKAWWKISLSLKVNSRIKLLTLNNLAYISNFPLNLVFFNYMQKRCFDWSNYLRKISENKQIIGYTRFHSNNDEIRNDKNGGMLFATLAVDLATPRNFRPYQRLHSASP